MRDVFYWPRLERLVYLQEAATPEYWDRYWETEGRPAPVAQDDYVVTTSRKYLEPGSRILEGGCGRGQKVKAMCDAGFAACGVDFADQSVRLARSYFPGVDFTVGDVRALDFPDSTFDGYWSIGVIEHFWDGYEAILTEAARVLRQGGVLFLTAPWFSPLRKRKAVEGHYPSREFGGEPQSFYQFALGRNEICAELRRSGFEPIHWQGLAAEMSLVEDISIFRRQLRWLFGAPGPLAKRALRKLLAAGMASYCGHSFLVVARCGKQSADTRVAAAEG